MNTSGHKVLITGGASGIGLALAKRFHAAGNPVVLVGRRADAADPRVSARAGAVHHAQGLVARALYEHS